MRLVPAFILSLGLLTALGTSAGAATAHHSRARHHVSAHHIGAHHVGARHVFRHAYGLVPGAIVAPRVYAPPPAYFDDTPSYNDPSKLGSY